jgi:hypothetical protein
LRRKDYFPAHRRIFSRTRSRGTPFAIIKFARCLVEPRDQSRFSFKDKPTLGVHGRSLRSFQASVALPSGSMVAVF